MDDNMILKQINYRSDFDFLLRLKDCRGKEIGWPTFNWRARFWSATKANVFEASVIDGEAANCFNDEGVIHVVADNHRLMTGKLHLEFIADIPNEMYPDGAERLAVPASLDVELVSTAAPCPKTFEVELQLPAIKVKFSELTAEEKAEMMAPAVEAAGRVDDALAGVTGATGAAGEAADAANRAAGKAEGAAGAARTAADAAQGAAGNAEGAADAANRAAGKANTATDEAIAAAAKANEAAKGLIRDIGKVEAVIDKADAARDAAIKAAMTAEEKAGLADTAATKATEAATEANNTNKAIGEAEARRVAAEEAREAAEDLRESAESLRAEEEAKRAEAEAMRVAAEESRDTEESKRAKAETLRVAAEKLRESAESKRAYAEQSRADDESLRAAEEAKRVKAEQLRAVAETERDEAESEREAAEQQRATEEQKRATAEAEREETFAGFEGEIADAKYSLLISMWESAWGEYGSYDPSREKPFVGNGVEMGYQEAIQTLMLFDGQTSYLNAPTYASQNWLRTNIPLTTYGGQDFSKLFLDCTSLEVANLSKSDLVTIVKLGSCFTRCRKLRKILPQLKITDTRVAFAQCEALEDFDIQISQGATVDLYNSPHISINSIKKLVGNAPANASANIYVHPDVYAKLTDETNTEWHQLLIDATAKNISFATT